MELFHAALSLDASERPGFLARIDDEAMRPEVESLLAALEQAEGDNFISAPAINDVIKMIAEERVKTMIGRKLEHYLLLSPLGAGAMGEVYLAHDPRLGRQVAVKLLPAEFTKDADRVRRFEQEARAASALNHPNIITVHDIGRADDLYFIVTEYVAGHTLRRQISDTEMKLSEILDVAIQVASALGTAHEAGIAHRDIKPENIMLRRDGYVKVLDFGLAKLIEPIRLDRTTISGSEALTKGQIKTAPGMVMGTPHYMSPEQIRGQEVDGRSDIFSLGVMLYEMAARRRPFEGASTPEVIAAILNREALPLARYSREVPAEFERVVSKALEKDRGDRYQVTRDLLLDLKGLNRRLEGGERLPLSPPQPSARNPLWSVVSILFLVPTFGLAAEISRRFLSGSPDIAGVLITLLLGLLCLLVGSSFTQSGQLWVELSLSRIGIKLKFQGIWRMTFTLTILLIICAFYFSLPAIAHICNDRGVRLQSAADLPAAIKNLERAVSLDPDYAVAHYNLASAYENVMEFDKAMAEYQAALRADPKAYFAYNNLARLYLKQRRDYANALNILNTAIELMPQEPDIRYTLYKNRGWAHFGLGYYDLATEDLREALKGRDDGAAAHCLLAQVLEARKNSAAQEWEACIAYAPGEADVEASWLSLAQERLKQGEER